MLFFNPEEPLLRRKQHALDIQDLCGLLRIDLRLGSRQVYSALYTRVDQAILLWGLLTLGMFSLAQFLPWSWQGQAIVWTGVTWVGVAGMLGLTWFWAQVERLVWVVLAWAGLLSMGTLITDWGIFGGQPWILTHLCHLWLAVGTVGYLLTGMGLQSRTFLLAAGLHLGGLSLLPWVPGWSFLTTGLIMGGTLLFLAELQWDMRLPQASTRLSETERQFNHYQRQQRQLVRRT